MVGVLEQLGYELTPPNAVQRLTQKVAASRPGAWAAQRVLYPLDKVLFRSTGGRSTVASLTAGLPVIMLTTTGAKSGEPRTMPLVGTPYGDDIAIIGSNYGQERTPGWVYNLESDPVAVVRVSRRCSRRDRPTARRGRIRPGVRGGRADLRGLRLLPSTRRPPPDQGLRTRSSRLGVELTAIGRVA